MSVTTIFKALAFAGVAAAYNEQAHLHKISSWDAQSPYTSVNKGGTQSIFISDNRIGQGAFGTVHQVMWVEELFIVKRISMDKVRANAENLNAEKRLFAEIDILKATGHAIQIMMVERGQALVVMPLSAYMSEQDQVYAEEEQKPILHMQSKSVWDQFLPCTNHPDNRYKPCHCPCKYEDKMPKIIKIVQAANNQKLREAQAENERLDAEAAELQEEERILNAAPTVSHVVQTAEKKLSFGRVEKISFAVYTIYEPLSMAQDCPDGIYMRFSDWFKVADEIRKATTTRWMKFRLSYNAAFRGLTRTDFAGLDRAFKALKDTKWEMRSDADKIDRTNCTTRDGLLKNWYHEFKKIAGVKKDRWDVMVNIIHAMFESKQ